MQEFWLRLSRSDASGVENLQAWFTTGVARVWMRPRRIVAWLRSEAEAEFKHALAARPEWREDAKRQKRFYRLSADGAAALDHLTSEWRGMNASLSGILGENGLNRSGS